MLKIWNEEEAKDASDDQLFVRLINKTCPINNCSHNHQHDDNDITLAVVDKSGQRIEFGTILIIDTEYSVVVLGEQLNKKIPLKTDIKGEPLVYSVDEINEWHSKIRSQGMGNLFSEKLRDIFQQIEKEEAGVH